MIRNSLLEILHETWPTMLICAIIIITLRITYLIKNKQRLILYKELLDLAFITYTLCYFL